MRRPPGAEDREIMDCSKAAFAAALVLEHYADAMDIDPAFMLAEIMIEQSVATDCGTCRAFMSEVHDIMQAREFFDRYSLYVLHDEKPEQKDA